jgi:cytochrome c oxidase subunit 2
MQRIAVMLLAACAVGCGGPQSTLNPAGEDADRIAVLFWSMTMGGLVVWASVVSLGIYCLRARPAANAERLTTLIIVGGGVVLPIVVLTGLLAYGLALLPKVIATAPEGSMRVSVVGEQWWWRVRYHAPDGRAVDLANEIRVPAGETIDVHLASTNVIHSFWIPSLAGKVDMIPGRLTRLSLEPTRTGVFRGACAEYCGTAHAFMTFPVVVLERDAFASWLDAQAAPAHTPIEPLAAQGHSLFLSNGCGACHTVRGTSADGVIGPDLTHVGSRISLAAGTLPNENADFIRWIARPEHAKPGAQMPAFGMLAGDDLRALAAYLNGLQ